VLSTCRSPPIPRGQVAADGEAQARALLALGGEVAVLHEGVEDTRLLLRWNAAPRVAHPDAHAVVRAVVRHGDGAVEKQFSVGSVDSV
jgi:hypothetical protein